MSEFLKSRVVWTNIISIVAVILVNFGIDISAESQAEILSGILALSNVATLIFKATPKQA